ncbi:MAG: trypsin-like peptidase domain-containing protein [Candidatus Delongbacteria bacterium]|nr:trypsin-like peptidase domain-containing protein [Candidatus Delongbacteria bacterium]MBN2833561.1 trypsin-like peptidase domain-containing protein [Candidatus Delongbacteria bacterium]
MKTLKGTFYALFFILLGVLLTAKFDFSEKVQAKEHKISEATMDKNEGTHSRFAVIAKEAMKSVVHVKVSRSVEYNYVSPFDRMFEDAFPFFKGREQEQQTKPKKHIQKSEGSGFIYSKDGYILTNNHVVEKSDQISVILHDGSEVEAKLIGNDPDTDLAVIKIDRNIKDDEVSHLGNSDDLWVGDWVIAIGSPYSLENTLTVGVVSAKGRSGLGIYGGGPVFQDFIQTDAAINPGNSGGPLLNMQGEVIGINAAVNSAAQGIGFAIPASLVKNIEKQLRENGQVKRGYLGISLKEISKNENEPLGLSEEDTGILITSVSSGTPAEEAGLKTDDIIIKLNNKKIDGFEKFRMNVASLPPGEKVELTVLRNGDEKTFDIELADRGEFLSTGKIEKKVDESSYWLGMKATPVTDEMRNRYNLKDIKGVLVSDIKDDSPVSGKLMEGDIIFKVWHKGKAYSIENKGDYNNLTDKLKDVDESILIHFVRNGQTQFVVIK